MSAEITELAAHPDLFLPDGKTFAVCLRWDAFCHKLFHTCQDLAPQEVENAG